jgi:uncharacterized protein YdhG (YjbR/CyaY superfamily)
MNQEERMKKSSAAPSNVGAYIAATPKRAQPMLRQLRRIIKAAAPDAEERISYRMPYYAYRGRLAYFAAFTNHVSIFVSRAIVKAHRKDLGRYKTSTATVQFPIGTPIPAGLVKKLVRAQVRANDLRSGGNWK